ncbi:MAG: DUF488 domain-containing protein [Qipengyuania sp.]|jgi:uncharacterized protein (DUF488 family)|nr:DUF488 domain-containing protein [Erythrobacter sp. G21629-S1]|tara:strand:+ start:52 stop:540 length:489 start_codon:yes stop_codon:yes gene_type:complete
MVSTIGYERASLADFIATLKISNIDVLVDIRDRAQSRRQGFSKTALSEALKAEGIDYLHLRELGDPKEGRDAARKGDYTRFRSIFGEVMEKDEAKRAIRQIEELSIDCEPCLMCFERDQSFCHRKIVADHLESTLKIKVRHLGVREGAAARRMYGSDQSAAA